MRFLLQKSRSLINKPVTALRPLRGQRANAVTLTKPMTMPRGVYPYYPVLSRTQRSVASSALLLALCGSLIAEAGLVRGGGRGARTIIEGVAQAGTVPFLVADPSANDNSLLLATPGSTVVGLTGAGLSSAAAYGYGPSGQPIGISHSWGRDCALVTECSFELGQSELMQWQGNIVGLPEQLNDDDEYTAVTDLRITWEFFALEEFDPATMTTAPSRALALGPDFVFSSLYEAQSDGSFAAGFGSPAVMLGESLGYQPAVDEFSNCFATSPGRPISTLPPTLPINEAYSRGDCREVSLDLTQESSAPTGAELQARVDEVFASDLATSTWFGASVALFLTAELIAPEDSQFANLYAIDGPSIEDALQPGASNLPTPDSIRALSSIEYRGCFGGGTCDLTGAQSLFMPISIVADPPSQVPLPATLWLFLVGVAGLLRRRR